jgi:outer membrane protein assembly factor BamD
MKWLTLPLLLSTALGALAAAGCRTSAAEDPVLQLSAAEALAEGKSLMEREKYTQARRFLSHAYEVEPNSAGGREALLLVADAHFLEGGNDNFIQAEAKYRDFQNRFPTSERADYVQFQIGNSLAARMERPDRDQEVTRKALAAYQDLQRLYPTSQYVAAAREKSREVRDNLAEHEFVVGLFYLRYGLPRAAVQRFETLLAEFPDYSARDKALYHLALAHERLQQGEEARKRLDQLRQEFPDSRYVEERSG